MTKGKDTALVPVEGITHSILIVRGLRVIIDRDLAAIYGVETRTLNQAVRRNAERFPEDFRFQLTVEEVLASRSQAVILKRGRGHNIKFLPYAFTEHGAIQAANILNSPRAVMMGIHVSARSCSCAICWPPTRSSRTSSLNWNASWLRTIRRSPAS